MPTLCSLPDEILHLILRFVHPNDAMSVQCTARRFRDVANEPLLWRFYCQTYFQHWDERHEFQQKLAARTSSVDWKRLYLFRAAIDATTTKLLDGILSSQSGRIEKFEEIISFGYDVKDTLLRHAQAGPELEDHLARRCVVPRRVCSMDMLLTRYADITVMLSLVVFIAISRYHNGLRWRMELTFPLNVRSGRLICSFQKLRLGVWMR